MRRLLTRIIEYKSVPSRLRPLVFREKRSQVKKFVGEKTVGSRQSVKGEKPDEALDESSDELPSGAAGRNPEEVPANKPAEQADEALEEQPPDYSETSYPQQSVQPTSRAEPIFSSPDSRPAAGRFEPIVPTDTMAEAPKDNAIWAWLKTLPPELKYILRLFVSTRIVLTLIGLTAYAVLPTGYGKQTSWSPHTWLDLWGVWDSLWYIDIAQNGYSTATKLPDFPNQTNFPFFPLYPLLMKLLGNLLGGHYFWAGLIISNVCLLLSCYVLYKLVEMQWGPKLAFRSVKYLFLFPVSFIFSGVFTESLYLLLSLLCFYLARRRQWWLAGLCGALLSATRTLGVLIALPLLFEYLRSIEFNPKRIRLNGLFLLLVPLGLAAFCVYNYQVTGDFFFFKTNQAAWDRELMSPITAFWQALTQGIGEPSFKLLLECAFLVAAFALLSAFYKKIGFPYWLLGMYSIFIPLSAGVASMPRFTLTIFPLFIVLAMLSSQNGWNRLLTFGLGSLQGALMVLWCTGHGLVI